MAGHLLKTGDCIVELRQMPDACIDSALTDPPYELGFMGKKWDATGIAYSVELWREVLRVLKPGGHLLSFGGTRTYHRMTCAIEDAGFEIRDCLQWLYGTGFPKSLNVSKALVERLGAEREKIRIPAAEIRNPKSIDSGHGVDGGDRPWMQKAMELGYHEKDGDTAVSEAAKQWEGWGTALKPACEPIVLARKPLEGTVAENVLKYGTGALNVDACRIEGPPPHHNYGRTSGEGAFAGKSEEPFNTPPQGRWPANVLLDEVAAAELDRQSGDRQSGDRQSGEYHLMGYHGADVAPMPAIKGDHGGASRFFYVAKPSRRERDQGCEHLPARSAGEATDRGEDTAGLKSPRAGAGRTGGAKNYHPTVKPVQLMRYLARLITPPGGIVLDPFMGSGTTGMAALAEGFNFAGIEREPEYVTIAEARIASVIGKM